MCVLGVGLTSQQIQNHKKKKCVNHPYVRAFTVSIGLSYTTEMGNIILPNQIKSYTFFWINKTRSYCCCTCVCTLSISIHTGNYQHKGDTNINDLNRGLGYYEPEHLQCTLSGTQLEECSILPQEIPPFGVSLTVVENAVSLATPESPISVKLHWDLVTETLQTPYGPLRPLFQSQNSSSLGSPNNHHGMLIA